jgi:hypothetical protein
MVIPPVSVIVTEPDLVVSSVLVALMRTEVPVLGAVKVPVEVIDPAEADQVTPEL